MDVLVINESKLNSKHDESIFEHPCYDIHRLDRIGSGGGGVMVYVKKNLNSSRVTFDDTSEIISFVIDSNSQKIGIIACYRPPYAANEASFFASIDKQLSNLEDLDTADTIIIGDLNYNMLDTKHSF